MYEKSAIFVIIFLMLTQIITSFRSVRIIKKNDLDETHETFFKSQIAIGTLWLLIVFFIIIASWYQWGKKSSMTKKAAGQ